MLIWDPVQDWTSNIRPYSKDAGLFLLTNDNQSDEIYGRPLKWFLTPTGAFSATQEDSPESPGIDAQRRELHTLQ